MRKLFGKYSIQSNLQLFFYFVLFHFDSPSGWDFLGCSAFPSISTTLQSNQEHFSCFWDIFGPSENSFTMYLRRTSPEMKTPIMVKETWKGLQRSSSVARVHVTCKRFDCLKSSRIVFTLSLTFCLAYLSFRKCY